MTATATPPEISRWLASLAHDLQRRKQELMFRSLCPVGGPQSAELQIDGKEYLQFCSNNYLGLAADPEVIDAARQALDRWGFGSGASRLISGSMESHHELETDIAAFKKTEAALVFPSGYAANMAVLTTFATPHDLIISDKLNHASLLDAAKATGARCRTFPHRNYQRLADLLDRSKSSDPADNPDHSTDDRSCAIRHKWIVTDTIFSMDGDLADLSALSRLARQHDALLVTDEAHATGVLGPDGRGVAAMCDVEAEVAVSVGTLSKALGSIGGFIAGPKAIIDSLVNRSRHFIYTTALPAACTAAARAALRLSLREPQRRMRVLTMAEHVRNELAAAGYRIGDSKSPIIPVMLGSTQQAMEAATWLREQGLYIPAIRPPTVPPNTARLRISLMATHTDMQIDRLLSTMKQMKKCHPPTFSDK